MRSQHGGGHKCAVELCINSAQGYGLLCAYHLQAGKQVRPPYGSKVDDAHVFLLDCPGFTEDHIRMYHQGKGGSQFRSNDYHLDRPARALHH